MGLCSGEGGCINTGEEGLGDVERRWNVGDSNAEPWRNGLGGLLVERGAMRPSEFLRERLRGRLCEGKKDMALEESETKRLERWGLAGL